MARARAKPAFEKPSEIVRAAKPLKDPPFTTTRAASTPTARPRVILVADDELDELANGFAFWTVIDRVRHDQPYAFAADASHGSSGGKHSHARVPQAMEV